MSGFIWLNDVLADPEGGCKGQTHPYFQKPFMLTAPLSKLLRDMGYEQTPLPPFFKIVDLSR